MRDFEGSADPSIYSQLIVQETPVYLLARDEDCENSFHSSADFVRFLSLITHENFNLLFPHFLFFFTSYVPYQMNMFLVLSILRIKPSDLQVMLYDK